MIRSRNCGIYYEFIRKTAWNKWVPGLQYFTVSKKYAKIFPTLDKARRFYKEVVVNMYFNKDTQLVIIDADNTRKIIEKLDVVNVFPER